MNKAIASNLSLFLYFHQPLTFKLTQKEFVLKYTYVILYSSPSHKPHPSVYIFAKIIKNDQEFLNPQQTLNRKDTQSSGQKGRKRKHIC